MRGMGEEKAAVVREPDGIRTGASRSQTNRAMRRTFFRRRRIVSRFGLLHS